VKYSYAIPLEIVYTTPLNSWNPYGFTIVNEKANPGNRAGGFTPESAFQNVNLNGRFFMTPAEFFTAGTADPSTVGVSDKSGVIQKVQPSGLRAFMPPIKGVTKPLRLRYPIAPLSFNKNIGNMNARALKHMMASGQPDILNSDLQLTAPSEWIWTDKSSNSSEAPENAHWHRLDITEIQKLLWEADPTAVLNVTTVAANYHSHILQVSRTAGPNGWLYTIVDCDKLGPICSHGHSKFCPTDMSC